MARWRLGDFHINLQMLRAISYDHSFNRKLSKKSSNNLSLHRSSCLSHWGRRCGSGNLNDRKISQHAAYLIVYGSKSIVPCTKRHIGKLCAVMNWCSQDLVHPLINNNLQNSIHWWTIDTIVFIRRENIPHNHKCDVTYARFWIKIVQKHFLEHLHYFHTWSSLLPPKYKANFWVD